MVYTHNPRSFDFNYWPPRPVEELDRALRPVNSHDIIELNAGLIYVHDDNRREQVRQVYALGNYADLEDFWLANKPPSTTALRNAYSTNQGDYHIRRNYLKVSSEMFNTIALALDGTNYYGLREDRGKNYTFLNDVLYGQQVRDEHYSDHVPPVYLDKRNLLIARTALQQCLDKENPLVYIQSIPWGDQPSRKVSVFGTAGHEYIERILENNQTYEDRLVPDTVPEEWL